MPDILSPVFPQYAWAPTQDVTDHSFWSNMNGNQTITATTEATAQDITFLHQIVLPKVTTPQIGQLRFIMQFAAFSRTTANGVYTFLLYSPELFAKFGNGIICYLGRTSDLDQSSPARMASLYIDCRPAISWSGYIASGLGPTMTFQVLGFRSSGSAGSCTIYSDGPGAGLDGPSWFTVEQLVQLT